MRYKQYAPDVLERIQKEGLCVLKEFIRICDKYNIQYFVVYGTNIGVVRHKGIIPWDDDIDVGMVRDEYEKFLKVAPKEIKNNFGIAAPEYGEKYYSLTTKFFKKGTRFATLCDHGKFNIGIYIDIFVFDFLAEDKKERVKQIRIANLLRKLYVLYNVNFFSNEMYEKEELVKRILLAGAHYLLKILPITNKMICKLWKKNAMKFHGKSGMVTQFSSTMTEESILSIEETKQLIEMPYEDIMVKVPQNYDRILRAVYGDYMQLPPPEKRQNHYPYILKFEEDES